MTNISSFHILNCDEKSSFEIINKFIENGGNFIDISRKYEISRYKYK